MTFFNDKVNGWISRVCRQMLTTEQCSTYCNKMYEGEEKS